MTVGYGQGLTSDGWVQNGCLLWFRYLGPHTNTRELSGTPDLAPGLTCILTFGLRMKINVKGSIMDRSINSIVLDI